MKKTLRTYVLLLLAGLSASLTSVAAPLLVSVMPYMPGKISVTVDWSHMVSDPQRDTSMLPCAGGTCAQQHVGLIANINGRDEDFPRITSRISTPTASEADALRLLTSASRTAGVSRYIIPLPVTSDLCFKYTLGYSFDVHTFSKPNCIAKSLLKTTDHHQ
ncbi:hypothetical protein AAGR22_08910 [Erwinia sp. HDF1-3R]|uniref:hypothetical protein n=1 Tax=Erwinia sp. HDF1-3R TaxID=3141543 RepID=UPI0031F5D47D